MANRKAPGDQKPADSPQVDEPAGGLNSADAPNTGASDASPAGVTGPTVSKPPAVDQNSIGGPSQEGSILRTFEDSLSRAADKEIQGPSGLSSDAGMQQASPPASPGRVEVICEGVLGPRMLRKGERTSDPAYVKLLETERGRRLVKPV